MQQNHNKKSSLRHCSSSVNHRSILPALNNLPTLPNNHNEIRPKYFYFNSQDHYIRRILLRHGWKQALLNKTNSASFDLIWIYNQQKLPQQHRHSTAKINHFRNSHLLTTKGGLMNALYRNSSSEARVSTFFPRSYDLTSQFDQQDFLHDFQRTAVMNLLKKLIVYFELGVGFSKSQHPKLSLKQYLKPQIVKFQIETNPNCIVPKQELIYIIVLLQKYKRQLSLQEQGAVVLDVPSDVYSSILNFSRVDPPYPTNNRHDFKEWVTPSSYTMSILYQYASFFESQFPYYRNDGFNNIWIVKPCESSKGRHLQLIDSLAQLKNTHNSLRIVQKYIENIWVFTEQELSHYQQNQVPEDLMYLIGKKFDARIWVLVTSFDPLEIYIYSEGYLRISSNSYGFQSLKNVRGHLTNYALNKTFQEKEHSFIFLTSLYKHLERAYNHTSLKKDIRKVIIQTLKSSTDINNGSRPNGGCFELFGFDILIDCDLKPWVLEVNMSPLCEQRGQLKQVLEDMGEGLLTIVGAITNSKKFRTQRESSWEKVYVDPPTDYFRTDLQIKGRGLEYKQWLFVEERVLQRQAATTLQKYFRSGFFSKSSQSVEEEDQNYRILSRTKNLISVLGDILQRQRRVCLKYGLWRVGKYCKYLRNKKKKFKPLAVKK